MGQPGEIADAYCFLSSDAGGVEGHLLDANSATLELVGLTAAELARGVRLETLCEDPADARRILDTIQSSVNGDVMDFGLRIRRLAASSLPCRLEATAWREPGGSLIGYQGILRPSRLSGAAEEERQDTVEALQRMLANAQDLISVVDDKGRVRFHTPSIERILGYRVKDRVGRSSLELVHEQDVPRVREAIRRGFRTGSIERTRARVRHRNGAWRHLEFVGKAYPVQGAGPMAVVSSRDVTEQVATSEALRRSEERFRSAFDTAPVAFIAWNRDREILDWNACAEQLFGWAPEAVRGADLVELLASAEERAEVAERLSDLIEHGRSQQSRNLNLTRSGGMVLCDWHSTPLRDQDGEVVGALSIAMDVTRRVRAEDHLGLFQFAVDSSADAAFLIRGDGRITFANDAACALLGRSRDEVLSMTGRDLDEALDPDHWEAMWREILDTGVATRETWMTRSDGSRIPVEMRANAGSAAGVSYAFAFCRDLTEPRRLQAQLLQSEKLSALGQLVSGVAHELNNPMTGVLGFAQLLMAQPGLGPKAQHYVEQIHAEADRSRRIVKNLLAFARQRKSERVEVSLHELIRRVLDLRAYEMKVNNIEVERSFAATLPKVLADAGHIQQVLMNLVINAEHAMLAANRGGRLEVRTAYDEEHARVLIEVADDGPGVPPELATKIFDPFFSTKPEGQGTGLGLSISYGILREHGGTIRLDESASGGARFVVELPLANGDPTPSTPPSAPPEPTDSAPGRVLVVDDEPGIVDLLRDALERAGHEVDVAYDGETALERISSRTYDVVLSDLKMPRMSGMDVFRRCLEDHPESARGFCFLTGEVIEGEARTFLEDMDVPFMTKPFSLRELVAFVGRRLETLN